MTEKIDMHIGVRGREKIRELVEIRDEMVDKVMADPNSLGVFGNFALKLMEYMPDNPSSRREIVERLVNTILADEINKRLGALIQ